MSFIFMKVEDCDLEQYKKDMQEAFQKGFEEEFGKTEEVILPRKDVDKALQTKGSIAYKAVVDGNDWKCGYSSSAGRQSR